MSDDTYNVIKPDNGQVDPLVERLLHHCALRGANLPGEPKLARSFLDEIERDSSGT